MSSGKEFDPEINLDFPAEDDFMEKNFEQETEKDGKMKTFIKRPDFPLVLLGGFILILLLFILVKLPVSPETSFKTGGFSPKDLKELKKNLKDIQNEIIEIKYGLSADKDTSGADFVSALNRLEDRFDKRLERIEKKLTPSGVNTVKKAEASPKPKKELKTAPYIKKPAVTGKNISKARVKTGKKVYHTVKKGDTLFGIARKYSVSVRELKSWNNMKNNFIHPGERLLIKHKN